MLARFTHVLAILVAVIGILAAVAGVGKTLVQSDMFEVRDVRAKGLERLDEAEILKGLRPELGTRLFDLDLASLKGRLLAEPWIREVSLRRQYPDALEIRIVEREPVAILAGRNELALVDETGTVIERQPTLGSETNRFPGIGSSLPVIYGIDAGLLHQGDPEVRKNFETTLVLLRDMPVPMEEELDLDVRRIDDVRLRRHGYWVLFGGEPFNEKWRRFQSVEEEIELRHPLIREVDLRFPEQVIVR